MKKHWLRNVLALLAIAALLVTSVAALAEEIPVEVGEVDLLDPTIYADKLIGDNATQKPGSSKGTDGEYDVLIDGGCLSVGESSVTIPVGGSRNVRVTFTMPSGYVYWKSSNESVADCRWSGSWSGDDTTLTIYGNKKGTATITITNDQNSDSATIKVTVGSTGVTLSVDPASISVAAGDTESVVVTFTGEGSVTWKSSNEKVATCQWGSSWSGDDIDLYITGVKKGSATITITNSVNSKKAKIKVKVTKGSGGGSYPRAGKKDGKGTYRALLIGEEAFNPICTRNRGDVTLMNKMLKSVKGPKGGKWTITQKFDINNAGVKSAIKSAFNKADEDDVSLFFIATHGDADSYGEYAGALAMIPEGGFLLMSELAAALKEVPGKVIVVIESCGSGAAVFSTYGEQNAANAALRNAAKAFDQSVIDAFAAVDDGIVEANYNKTVAKTDAAVNTGELRVSNKFYVLTASRYLELSWGTEQGPYNFFTKWFTDGVGTSGKMPADTNSDKKLTLKEAFSYISKVGDNHSFYDGTGYYYQHVQCYPKNSAYVLFKR